MFLTPAKSQEKGLQKLQRKMDASNWFVSRTDLKPVKVHYDAREDENLGLRNRGGKNDRGGGGFEGEGIELGGVYYVGLFLVSN